MNQPSEFRLGVRGAGRDRGSSLPTIKRLLLLCAALAMVLLLIAETRLSSEQRLQLLQSTGFYP
jgi:hypothetical protein